jgi:hypothetical protein
MNEPLAIQYDSLLGRISVIPLKNTAEDDLCAE